MSKKRYRAPKAKDGELKAQWGKLPYDNPNLCYAWGDGIPKCDGRLLHYMFAGKRYSPIDKTWDDSFIEELEKRGYDLTTLKFSIQKKSR
ncbi:MAG: hypothetical protein P8X74_03740 [Reinekea sp.]